MEEGGVDLVGLASNMTAAISLGSEPVAHVGKFVCTRCWVVVGWLGKVDSLAEAEVPFIEADGLSTEQIIDFVDGSWIHAGYFCHLGREHFQATVSSEFSLLAARLLPN